MAANNNPMSDAQVALIRNLFKQVRHLLTKEQETLIITEMRKHQSGEQILPVIWGTEAIDAMKGVRTRENLRIARERRAANNK